MKLTAACFCSVIGLLLVLNGCQTNAPLAKLQLKQETRQVAETIPIENVERAVQLTATPTVPEEAAFTVETPEVVEVTPQDSPSGILPDSISCEQDWCLFDFPELLQRAAGTLGNSSIERTYPFGSTQMGERETHTGVEFNLPDGSPVLAAADGKVLFAGSDNEESYGRYPGIYGNVIILEHTLEGSAAQLYSLYAHLSEIQVETGDYIRSGQTIGRVGASGFATGSHLHFEVRVGSASIDYARNPLLYLNAPTGENGQLHGVLIGSILDAQGNFYYTQSINLQFIKVDGNYQPLFSIETYAKGVQPDEEWQENFAVDSLSPGKYRLSVVYNGRVFEKVVPVQAGKLTYVKIQLGE